MSHIGVQTGFPIPIIIGVTTNDMLFGVPVVQQFKILYDSLP